MHFNKSLDEMKLFQLEGQKGKKVFMQVAQLKCVHYTKCVKLLYVVLRKYSTR